MKGDADGPEELRRLQEALIEGRIAPDQLGRLEELLLYDPTAAWSWITHATMQADLIREFGGHPPIAAGEPGGVDGPGPRGRAASRSGWVLGAVSRWVPWGIAAAACLIAVQALTSPSRRDPVAGIAGGTSGGAETRDGRPYDHDRSPLAVLVKLVDARWEEADGPAPTIGRALPAGRLRLRSGLATLAYVNGVLLTLEGPADVELVSVDRVFCRRGRLRSRVPKGAEGFVIASPSSALVDLGTELAVNVDPDGRSRVMVFEGAAEAAILTGSGAPGRSQIIEKDKAFDLDPNAGRIAESPALPEAFVASPRLIESDLDLATSYRSEVIRSRPRGYWRFESLVDGLAPNEIEGSTTLRVNGPIRVARSPGGNGYAVFGPDAPEQCLDADALWELPAEPGHAVELWFQSDSYRRGSLVGLYPPRSTNPPADAGRFLHAMLVEAMSCERLMLHKPASVRFMHRRPVDIRVADCLFSEHVFVPGRWHHVVAQKRDGRLDLFFDGILERSAPLKPDHPTLSCLMVVGRRTPEAKNPDDSRSFVGRIDELAIYDHPLSEEEVTRHFRLGSESLSPD